MSARKLVVENGDTEFLLQDPQSSSEGDATDELFTLREAIDQSGFGLFQRLLCAWCGISFAADAMEMMLLSYLTQAVQHEWHIEAWQGSLLTTVVFLGILIGASFWGYIADKFGRRNAMVGLTSTAVLFGILSAFASSVWTLMIFRMMVGCGVGGAHVSFSLFAEFLPTSSRGITLMFSNLFWTAGIILEAGLAWLLLERYPLGWQYFVGATAVPLCIILLFFLWLPESPRWLLISGKEEQAMRVLQRVARANKRALPHGRMMAAEDMHERGRFRDLFSPTVRSITVPIWVLWFVCTAVYYGVIILTPAYFEHQASSNVYFSTFIASLAEIPSVFLAAFLIQKVGRKITLMLFFGATSVFLLPLIATTAPMWILMIAAIVSRLSISAAFNTVFIYTPELYPTPLRGIGFGAASSVARLAGMTTPFVAGPLFQQSVTLSIIVYSFIAAVAVVAAYRVPVETKAVPLQDSFLPERSEGTP